MMKKLLSVVLCAVMLLNMLPTGIFMFSLPVSAAEIPIDESKLTAVQPQTYTTGTYTLKDTRIYATQAGQSAIVISGSVTLIIEGMVVLKGGNADYYNGKGAGAGIEVPAGSSLTLKGSGTLVAQGGNAADGGDGTLTTTTLHEDGSYSTAYRPGMGGGGAGAGIGTRGADGSQISGGTSAAVPGSVTIADENLLVQVTGGQGGSGGKGGDGGTCMVIDRFYRWWGVPALGEQCYTDLTVLGGSGGSGGGGGGYPAAGIGAGGASGGAGGFGGSGAVDKNTIDGGVMVVAVFSEKVHFSAAGGGGGGGGQGFVNGGGGGGGAAFCDTLFYSTVNGGALAVGGLRIHSNNNHDVSLTKLTIHRYDGIFIWDIERDEFYTPVPTHRIDLTPPGTVHGGHEDNITKNGSCTCSGSGGESGQNGYDVSQRCKCGSLSNGYGGISGGAGGLGGEGRNAVRKPDSGSNGNTAGKKAGGGTVTLNAGTLRAVSGGGNAMDIGSGDGIGTANAGSLYIRGGAMDEGNYPTPTNGSEAVYPVIVRPFSYVDDFYSPTDVLVNDKEWGVTRFIPGRSDGQLTVWLPNGEYTAAVASTDGSFACKYPAFTVNGIKTEPVPDAIVRLDVSEGPITFNSATVVQNGNTVPYTSNVYLYNSSETANAVTFVQNAGAKRVTLQNASITSLNISSGCTVTLNSEGTQNTITTINNKASDTADVIFEGDVTSVLNVGTVDNVNTPREAYWTGSYTYISEVAVGTADSTPQARKNLTDNGFNYILEYELNKGAGGTHIYIGYKTTTNPDEAIYELMTGERSDPMYIWQDVYYHEAPCYGGNGDLNQGAGGDWIKLYYAKKSDYIYGTNKNPISHIEVFGDEDYQTAVNKRDPNVYPEWMVGLSKDIVLVDGGHAMELNRKAGGDYIYIGINRYFPGITYVTTTRPDLLTHPVTSSSKLTDSKQSWQRAGDITMNSLGTVKIGLIQARRAESVFINPKTNQPSGGFYYRATDRWGTSNLTVNSGRLVFDEYIKWNDAILCDPNYSVRVDSNGETEIWPYIYQTYYYDPFPSYAGSWQHKPMGFSGVAPELASNWNFYGYNRLGNVTVNGGTLQIGDGTGTFPDGKANGFSNEMSISVAPGGNLLANAVDTNTGKSELEITGLPENEHLSFIPDTITGAMLGSYTGNMDVWTNDNGNFITYLPFYGTNEREIVFTASDGEAYRYLIEGSMGDYTAKRQTLPTYTNPNNTYTLRIHPKYMVQGKTLYAHTEGEAVSITASAQDILLADGAKVDLSAADGAMISSISGDGELTLTSGGHVIVVSKIAVPKFTFTGGSLSTREITGNVTILGGSVKTGTPIIGAKNEVSAVYQAILPLWSTAITVDGKAYPMDNARSHGDGKTYIYVPADARFVKAGGEYFMLTFDEQTQTMQVCRRISGNGHIDLSIGGAEILTGGEYIHNGQYYINANGENYTVTGESDVNTLNIMGGNPAITLNGVKLTGRSVEIAAGVNAAFTLVGENTLVGKDGIPSIHVPTGASLTITGTGILHADGGSGAPAIGGSMNEANGTVTINGGTLNLKGSGTHAIGAGSGAQTLAGSIIINGGSIKTGDLYSGDAMGTTPVNAQRQPLSRVVMKPDGTGTVSVDGVNYNVVTPNTDGRLYLYMVSREQTVYIGDKSYRVSPLNIQPTTNGTLSLRLLDGDTEIPLKSGDMVVEGTMIRVIAAPSEGYGLVSGPATGDYILTRVNDNLVLKAADGFGTFAADGWTAVQTEDMSFGKELNNSSSTVKLGVANAGHASVMFAAVGQGITAEILVNGQVVKTVTLSGTSQTVYYDWMANASEPVELRFSGTGTVTLTSALLSEIADSASISAVFAEMVTLNLIQQQENIGNKPGIVHAYDAETDILLMDRDPAKDGLQVLAGTKVRVVFEDPNGGNIFLGFIVTIDSEADSEFKEPTVTGDYSYTFVLTKDTTVTPHTVWKESHLEISNVVFEAITYGDDAPAAKEIPITDRGNTSAVIQSIALSGDGANSFELTAVSPLSVTGNTVRPKSGLTTGTHTAVITVTYNDGKTATAEVSIAVEKKTVDVPVLSPKSYTGSTVTADVPDSAWYTVTENKGGIDVGRYTVVLTLKDPANCRWADSDTAEKMLTFDITESDASFTKISTYLNDTETNVFTYGDIIKVVVSGVVPTSSAYSLRGQPKDNKMALYVGDTQISDAVDAVNGTYTMFCDTTGKQLAIGDNTISVKYAGSDNMSEHTETVTVTLNCAVLTAVIDVDSVTKAYDGTTAVIGAQPALSIIGLKSDDKVAVADGISYTYEDTAVGTDKTIHASGIALVSNTVSDYYSIAETASGTGAEITRRDITVTARAHTKMYGETDPTFLYDAENIVNGEILNGELTRESGEAYENVGTYDILQGTLTDENNPNYKIKYVGNTLTISTRVVHPEDVVILLSQSSYVYDGQEKEPTVTVRIDGNEIPANEYTVSYSRNTEVGEAMVTVTDNPGGNYEINGTAGFIITRAKTDMTANTDDDSYIYGDMITVTVGVSAAGEAASYGRRAVPGENQAALFLGEKQLTEPQTVDGQHLTFKINTFEAGLVPSRYRLTAKYYEGSNMASAYADTGEITVSYLISDTEAELSGTEGLNNWFIGDVTVNAPESCLIADTLKGNETVWVSSLTVAVDGETEHEYYLKNSLGQITDVKHITVLRDTTRPVIAIAETSDVTDTSAVVTVAAEDLTSGIAEIALADTENTGAVITDRGNGVFWISGLQANRGYTFEASVTDCAGNVSERKQITFTATRSNLSNAEVTVIGEYIYDGSPKIPELKVMLNGRELVPYTDYTLSYSHSIGGESNHTDAGIVTVTIIGDGDYSGTKTVTFEILKAGTVSSPVIHPDNTQFTDSLEISILCATEGAVVYYTTDGSDPAVNGTVYTEAFKITANTKVRAIAVKANMDDSSETVKEYILITDLPTRVEMSEQIIVSPELARIDSLNTPVKIDYALRTAISRINGFSVDNTISYEVELQYLDPQTGTWMKANEEHFPENGQLWITLPYPAGTSAETHEFTVAHMFSSSAFRKIPGDIEYPAVTEASDGLSFCVTGLSPITIGWTEEKREDDFNYGWWFVYNMILYGQEFDITATASDGGTITPEGVTKVRYGISKRYTITPDEGYMIEDVIVDGISVGAVEVYNFDNVSEAHTITAIFAEIPWQNPFKDIWETDIYYDDVKYVCENGLMLGIGDGIFSPDEALTRIMLVTVLWRAAGQPMVDSTADFSDVPANQWYSKAIAWASANGIVIGYGDGTFGINDLITREQLAVILYRYECYLGGGFNELRMITLGYDDAADVADWAYEAMCWMTVNDIYVAHEGGLLDPKENATRAETAAFLRRFCEYRKEQEEQ